MSAKNSALTELPEATRSTGEFHRTVKVLFKRKVIVFSFIVILITIICAIFAPLIAPYDPYKPNPRNAMAPPSWQHLLGTDPIGRDLLSRLIFGTRTALLVGLIATGIASLLGMTMGMIAGYFTGWVSFLIMRIVDGLISFPFLVLALLLGALLGGGLTNIMIAIGIGMSAMYARVMFGLVLSIKNNDYITAARAYGASNMRIMVRHVLVNCFPPFMVLITINMGGAIMVEAALSYLGLGISPPGAAWGNMVNAGFRYLLTHPVFAIVPGIAIALVVYSFNMLGDGLRDALDPRLRGTL
ncbi:MAG TPA: ABC transporter permease [Dehalococcoidales bacterium]|nr:ABC transporter permease [Dehalococcoidales bacterium]